MTGQLQISDDDFPVNPQWERECDGSLNTVTSLSGKFCPGPFSDVQIHAGGKVTVCCPMGLPRQIGVLEETGLKGLWNSAAAQKIRQSVLDGSYRYCNHRVCDIIQRESLLDYEQLTSEQQHIVDRQQVILDHFPCSVMLAYDASCNLSCPSCRTGKKCFTEGSPEHAESKRLTGLLKKDLLASDHSRPLALNITGSGDPFASPVFLDLLENFEWEQCPHIRIDFQTNGTLFTEQIWRRLWRCHRHVRNIAVSVDAATPDTYAVVRRGGDWGRLMENMKFLAGLRRDNKSLFIRFNMVVQQRNFHEMPQFVKEFLGTLCDSVKFFFLNDWGTWASRAEYERQCIWKKTHPEFQDFLRVLRDPVFNNSMVDMGDVFEYRQIALDPGWVRRAGGGPGAAFPPQAARSRVERYLKTNDPRLFRLSFLLNPVFLFQRAGTLASWRDFRHRFANLIRLLRLKSRQ
ncbi:MAG: hypothetical protein A2234_09520 [Elusimicrobia bacterium RIFOXYA2_FULL_58_8]|nr:MAG: hypothetical protein A2285_06805 [Elusimicrobia bacterium RIFOXYA12_FULL_57_11]OGS14035.1 MAG: hypothetical protein A2234_09520 [Elusimicrobia bacterium RIFOXYA2_FULL_58_8]